MEKGGVHEPGAARDKWPVSKHPNDRFQEVPHRHPNNSRQLQEASRARAIETTYEKYLQEKEKHVNDD